MMDRAIQQAKTAARLLRSRGGDGSLRFSTVTVAGKKGYSFADCHTDAPEIVEAIRALWNAAQEA